MANIPRAAGIVWYENEEIYNKALSIFEDSFKLPATYQGFLVQYAAAVRICKQRGFIPIKAELDPSTFPDWCAARYLHVDAAGRAEWGNWKAMEYLRENGLIHE